MTFFQDKVVVITGAASGIGKGMAETFAAAGAKLIISDIEQARLDAAQKTLAEFGTDVTSLVADVSIKQQVEDLAQCAFDTYGACHVVCNNAGVAENNLKTWELSAEDWAWVLGVNLNGVINGVSSFVPKMLAAGEWGHVVNTASIGGLISGLALPAYSVSKHGVVALSECLYNDLKREQAKIGVSVLCPGWINTGIGESDRNRIDKPALTPELERSREAFKKSITAGLDPREVGQIVLDGIETERFYLYTHPEWNNVIVDRFDAIMDGKKPASTYLPRS